MDQWKNGLQQLYESFSCLALSPAPAADVDCDAEQPGLESGIATIGIKRVDRTDKNILRDIFCFRGIIQDR